MRKFKKVYHFKVALLTISTLFLFNSTIHCYADALRVPVGVNRTSKRMVEKMGSSPISFTNIVQKVFQDRGYIIDGDSLDTGWRCVIFKATEIATSKVVVIKIANPYGDHVLGMCRAYCWAMRSEVRFWKQRGIFNHNFPALIQLYDAGFIPRDEMNKYVPSSNEELLRIIAWDYHYQILEFVDGKSVKKLLDHKFFVNNKDVVDKLVEFIYGIDDLHKAGLTHGEILPKNVMVDKNMKFKACDLDSLGIAYEKKEKDIRYLYGLVKQILQQAYGNIFDDFFEKWTSDYVARYGLRSFADALTATNKPSIKIGKDTRAAI